METDCKEIADKLDALALYLGLKIEICNHKNYGWVVDNCKDCNGTDIVVKPINK